MEELLAAILEEIAESDLIAEGAMLISEDILSDLTLSGDTFSYVYSTITETLAVFKKWMTLTLKLTEYSVNALLGIQLMYNMIQFHYGRGHDSGMQISVTAALRDMEGTMKKNFQVLINMAKKQIAAPSFSKLPVEIQRRIRSIESETPMQYWLSVKDEILKSLMKIPLYSHS